MFAISVDGPQGAALGSGFLIAGSAEILTNYHVVHGATRIRVKTRAGQTLPGSVAATAPKLDLAVVKVTGLDAGIKPLALADAAIEQGDEVVAFGSPLGIEWTVTTGIVSAVNRSVDAPGGTMRGMTQTSAPISGPGAQRALTREPPRPCRPGFRVATLRFNLEREPTSPTRNVGLFGI